MEKITYFKRLDYRIEDISPVAALPVCFFTESETARYIPIDQAAKENIDTSQLFNFEKAPGEYNCGLGLTLVAAVHKYCNSGFYLHIDTKNNIDTHTAHNYPSGIDASRQGMAVQAEFFFVHICLDTNHNVLYDKSSILIADGSAARIILYCDTAEEASSIRQLAHPPYYRNGLLSVTVGKNAYVEIIKIQNCADTAINFESIRMDVNAGATVSVYDVYLGSYKTGVSYTSYIKGDGATVHIQPLYFADKNRRMDIEHNLVISGKNTKADITARGALKNHSHKIFRGNIFFNKGCSQSVARFSDNSIMLDKKASGISIPTIFCDEDDVVGEHAASFEAIGKEKLYYLMSRGFDEQGAKKMIIESIFRPVFNHIRDKQICSKLNGEFDRRLM